MLFVDRAVQPARQQAECTEKGRGQRRETDMTGCAGFACRGSPVTDKENSTGTVCKYLYKYYVPGWYGYNLESATTQLAQPPMLQSLDTTNCCPTRSRPSKSNLLLRAAALAPDILPPTGHPPTTSQSAELPERRDHPGVIALIVRKHAKKVVIKRWFCPISSWLVRCQIHTPPYQAFKEHLGNPSTICLRRDRRPAVLISSNPGKNKSEVPRLLALAEQPKMPCTSCACCHQRPGYAEDRGRKHDNEMKDPPFRNRSCRCPSGAGRVPERLCLSLMVISQTVVIIFFSCPLSLSMRNIPRRPPTPPRTPGILRGGMGLPRAGEVPTPRKPISFSIEHLTDFPVLHKLWAVHHSPCLASPKAFNHAHSRSSFTFALFLLARQRRKKERNKESCCDSPRPFLT